MKIERWWDNGVLVRELRDGVEIKNNLGLERELIKITISPVSHLPSPVSHEWPAALLPFKLMAKEGDRGAGDILARVIGPIGGNAFKKWYKTLFGKSCGCGARQEILNRRWPL